MASESSPSVRFRPSMVLAVLCCFPLRIVASPWIVTAKYEEIVTVISGYTDNAYGITEPATTLTNFVTVTSPTGVPVSTATITQTDDYKDTYTVVQVLYPYNSPASPSPTTYDSVGHSATEEYPAYTNYVVNLSYNAPTSCSTTWSYTTAVPVDPPYEIQNALSPVAASTSYSVDNSRPFKPTTITDVYVFVDPTQLPAVSLSALSSSYQPYPPCYNPAQDNTNSGVSSSSSSSTSSSSTSSYDCGYYYCSSDGSYNWLDDPSYYGISPLAIILISILGWSFIIFVAGLFENYFYFQRLMKGWQARRGLPITWWFLVFPVTTLLCLGFSRKGFQARNEEDAKELERKWREMGFWKRKGLWLKHGFTWGYPSLLGPAPPRVGRPSDARPTRPLLQVTPPASEPGDASRQGTPRVSGQGYGLEQNSAAVTEMSEVHPSQVHYAGTSEPQTTHFAQDTRRSQQVSDGAVTSISEEDEPVEAPPPSNPR